MLYRGHPSCPIVLPSSDPAPHPCCAGVKRFDDTATEGYGWTQDGALNWPGKEVRLRCCAALCRATCCVASRSLWAVPLPALPLHALAGMQLLECMHSLPGAPQWCSQSPAASAHNHPPLPVPSPPPPPLILQTKGLQELSEQAAEFLQQQRARELAAAGAGGNGAGSNGSGPAPPTWWAPNNPYTVRTDIADLLGESKDN